MSPTEFAPRRSNPTYAALLLVGGFSLACSSSGPDDGQGGTTNATGGTSASVAGSSGSVAGNGSVGTGGTASGGNGSAGTAGAGNGGSPTTTGGATGASGAATAGSPTGGTGAGGTGAGGTGAGGAGGTGMVPGETKPNVTAPASSKVFKDYFVMGETRLINNAWGAQELNCKPSYEIFVAADKSFGWKWDRNSVKCGGNAAKPDYPEVEFGIHPFGKNKSLVTSPDYSSTTVLPIQIKDVTSASVQIDSMNINVTGDINWNMNFEMWLTDQHPVTGNHMGAYAETMNWFGWDSKQYTWDDNGTQTLEAGQTWKLGHADDNWPPSSSPKWKYRQYRLPNSTRSFSGTVDVKKILDHLVNNEHWPNTLWISRFEVGTELDDGSAGTLTIKKITFEVNGQKRDTVVN